MALQISLQVRHSLPSKSTLQCKSSSLKTNSKLRIRNLKTSKLKMAMKMDKKIEVAEGAVEVEIVAEVVEEEAEAAAKIEFRTMIRISKKNRRVLLKATWIAPNLDKVIDVIKVEVVAEVEVEAVAKIRIKNKIRKKMQRLKKIPRLKKIFLSRDKEVAEIEAEAEVAAEVEVEEAITSRTKMSHKLYLRNLKIRKKATTS